MSKYDRPIVNSNGNTMVVDVYDVLKAFDVTCPALQHLAKKALCAGLRGHKDRKTDLQDIVTSAKRAVQMEAVIAQPQPAMPNPTAVNQRPPYLPPSSDSLE